MKMHKNMHKLMEYSNIHKIYPETEEPYTSDTCTNAAGKEDPGTNLDLKMNIWYNFSVWNNEGRMYFL